MAKENYYSLDFTRFEVDELLGYVRELKGTDEIRRITLTEEEYLQLREALKFVFEFNGDYEKLTNKPTIPTSVNQLQGYVPITEEKIEYYVERAIEFAELATKHDSEINSNEITVLYNMCTDLSNELDRYKLDAERMFIQKGDLVFEESTLPEHEHFAYEIQSCLKDENVYTLKDDVTELNDIVTSLKEKIKEYSTKITELTNKVNQLNSSIITSDCKITRRVNKLEEQLIKKADVDHTHDEFASSGKDTHEHYNKTVLDTLDSAKIVKWDATSQFVGNARKINLDSENLLDSWVSANSTITTTEVGGIPAGSDLEGKSLYEILNMMLYTRQTEGTDKDTLLEDALKRIEELEAKVAELENK